MGISHPLSDEFHGGGGMLPAASCCSAVDFLEHVVSRMDTLAGIAIKYGVQISDIKRANSLVTDSQMYAHKALLIPLPGRPVPSSVRLNGSITPSKGEWAPNHQQNRDVADSLGPSNSSLQRSSLAMSSLQSYYGLSSHRSDGTDYSAEMSLDSDGSSQVIGSETMLDSPSPPGSIQGTGRSHNSEDATNGASGIESNGVTREKQDGSIRRRQKVEADTPDDLLSDSIKMIRSFLPRPISSIRLSTDASSPDLTAKSGVSFLDGFKSACGSRRAPRALCTRRTATGSPCGQVRSGPSTTSQSPGRCSTASQSPRRFAEQKLLWTEPIQVSCTVPSVSAEFEGKWKRKLGWKLCSEPILFHKSGKRSHEGITESSVERHCSCVILPCFFIICKFVVRLA